jgi:hypothetical protein
MGEKAASMPAGAPRADLGESTGVLAEEHRDSRGVLRLWQQQGLRVYSTRVIGHLSIGLARHIIRYVDPLFEQGRVLGFHDWFLMNGYDSASRNELTTWSLRHSARAQINIGVRSTLVNMGVTVASLALGTQVLRRFSDEGALEQAFQRALRSVRE